MSYYTCDNMALKDIANNDALWAKTAIQNRKAKERMRIKRAEDRMVLEDYIDLSIYCTDCTPGCSSFYRGCIY